MATFFILKFLCLHKVKKYNLLKNNISMKSIYKLNLLLFVCIHITISVNSQEKDRTIKYGFIYGIGE
jgi:hypothetical protein